MRYLLLLPILFLLGCKNGSVLTILSGATHACGTIHVEGYWTDTQGDVIVAKAPVEWTPSQVEEFCSRQGN